MHKIDEAGDSYVWDGAEAVLHPEEPALIAQKARLPFKETYYII
jgi:hypothetical protein